MASSYRISAGEGSSSSSTRGKRDLTESACTACQKRKCKCDGLRPVCTRCKTSKTPCNWEVEVGESRVQALKRQIGELKTELANRDEAWQRQGSAIGELVNRMRQRPETAYAIRYVSIMDDRNAVEVLTKVKAQMALDSNETPYPQTPVAGYQRSAVSTPPVSPMSSTTVQPAAHAVTGLPPLTSLVNSHPPNAAPHYVGQANQQLVYRMSNANYTVGSDYLQRGNVPNGKRRQG